MTGQGLGLLLKDAVQESERQAPSIDPVAALSGAKRRAQRRRGHVVVLSFVVFAGAMQAIPSEAFGYSPRPGVAAVVHAERAVQAQVLSEQVRLASAGRRG